VAANSTAGVSSNDTLRLSVSSGFNVTPDLREKTASEHVADGKGLLNGFIIKLFHPRPLQVQCRYQAIPLVRANSLVMFDLMLPV
jgi:hypothetical protein